MTAMTVGTAERHGTGRVRRLPPPGKVRALPSRGPAGALSAPRLAVVPRHRPDVVPRHRPDVAPRHRPDVAPRHRPDVVPQFRPDVVPRYRTDVVPRHRAAAGRGRLAAAHPVRLTRRGRVVVTALLTMAALLLVTLAWLFGVGRAQAAGGSPPDVYQHLTTVVVRPGESLWSIAERAQPAADPRAVVQELIGLNGLSGSTIRAGERLWVPRG